MIKTNAIRILEQNKINHNVHSYDDKMGIDGKSVAKNLGKESDEVYKTLVTNHEKEYFVFIIPVNSELDLKKAAKVASVKRIEMIKQKDLLPLTGYIHGGCSPIGMKKHFKTFIQEDSLSKNSILVSAGKIGLQIELNPEDLAKTVEAEFKDIIKREE